MSILLRSYAPQSINRCQQIRNFAMYSPKKPRLAFEGLPTPKFSRLTIKRQALAQSKPYYMDKDEFQRSRCPFPAPVVSKLPLTHRALSPASIMQQLQHEELHRVKATHPSHRDKFQTGDRICVTKYISLSDKTKIERVNGLVMSRHGGQGINARFTVRNVKLDETFELQMPLWSPFIVRIDVLERGPRRYERRKQHFMRQRERSHYETVLREVLPKNAAGKRSFLKGSPMAIQMEKEANLANKREKERQRHDRETIASQEAQKDSTK